MVFLDFEQPLESLYEQLDKIKQVGEEGDIDVAVMVKELETKIKNKRKEIYSNLTGWQKVQLSRHPERPYTIYYIQQMCNIFEIDINHRNDHSKPNSQPIGMIQTLSCRQSPNSSVHFPSSFHKSLDFTFSTFADQSDHSLVFGLYSQ